MKKRDHAYELGPCGGQRGRAGAYQRSNMLERRRPTMAAWADFLEGGTSAKVIPLTRGKQP